jgi:hypothetical protein
VDALGGVYTAAKAVGLVPVAHLPLTLLAVEHGTAQHSLLSDVQATWCNTNRR